MLFLSPKSLGNFGKTMPKSASETPPDLPKLAKRDRFASKRDYGRVAIVGGASGMPGAPALAGLAALRSGTGLVELLVPETVTAITASYDPCLMTYGLPADSSGTFSLRAADALLERLAKASTVAVGPGLGRSEATVALVNTLWHELTQPTVFDADALWALAQSDFKTLSHHAGIRILTPHAGEMLRLLGHSSTKQYERNWLEQKAQDMAEVTRSLIVLKGHSTLITDGAIKKHNETGNPGMATGGTGDVLTGIIAALLSQNFPPFDASRLGVWVHGRSGDLASRYLGEISMTARDLVLYLPQTFQAVIQSQS